MIITSLAILIAAAGYLNFADVDLGFKDQEASTDSSSILEEVEYDLTDETALLDENGADGTGRYGQDYSELLREKPYLQGHPVLQPRQSFPESRSRSQNKADLQEIYRNIPGHRRGAEAGSY